MTSDYAWIVDSTRTPNEDDTGTVEDTEYSRNGTMGPRTAPADLLARLKAGEGRKWRTLVDVDYAGHPEEPRVIHIGRYLDRGEDSDAEAEFGPLDDLSQPDSGCVDIQYQNDQGKWETL